MQITRQQRAGLPHSEISGSQPVSGSPKLIAACHVLHRLLAPRHPPYTFCSLTTESAPGRSGCFLSCLSFSCILAYSVVKDRSERITACPKACVSKSMKTGGAERDRTADPLLAKQVLSQLSYSPIITSNSKFKSRNPNFGFVVMVGLGRVELPTSPLSGVRSNQLSYRPVSFRLRTFPGGKAPSPCL